MVPASPFGLFGGMLSFFPSENAQIVDTGQVGKALPHSNQPGDFCDLGFYCMRWNRRVPRCLVRAFKLPRTVDSGVFAPEFRQDGLCPRILPRAIRCIRQGCSAMERACPQKRPFAFGVLDCWQKAGWFVNKGTGARSCRVAPRVDRMRRLSRKARVGSARRITEGCRKRGGVTKGALSPRGA